MSQQIKVNRPKKENVERVIHWPTLNTVMMVEQTLKEADESIVSIAELKRRLPRKVNHNTLMIILDYLEKSNKIGVSLKGITWVYNIHPGLKKAISEGMEV